MSARRKKPRAVAVVDAAVSSTLSPRARATAATTSRRYLGSLRLRSLGFGEMVRVCAPGSVTQVFGNVTVKLGKAVLLDVRLMSEVMEMSRVA